MRGACEYHGAHSRVQAGSIRETIGAELNEPPAAYLAIRSTRALADDWSVSYG